MLPLLLCYLLLKRELFLRHFCRLKSVLVLEFVQLQEYAANRLAVDLFQLCLALSVCLDNSLLIRPVEECFVGIISLPAQLLHSLWIHDRISPANHTPLLRCCRGIEALPVHVNLVQKVMITALML